MKKTWLYGAIGLLALGTVAYSQVPSVPQVTAINSNDLFQDVVNGLPQAQNYYASAALLGNYSASLAGNNSENALIGGDATTNLFAYGTTGSSVTTTQTYGGPNRWIYWSGTSTAMTVSQDSTAADLPTAGYQYAFKMARTSGQTGVVQVCMAQEVESVNSYAFAGNTAELDFHAIPGANYSPANGNIQPYIIYGTGTDQGVARLAYGLNAGGTGTIGWTGQVNLTANVQVGGGGRVTFVAPIPTTATEVAVAICFTPVGTAGTNDYIALSGIQLTRNSALTATAGASGAGLPLNDTRAKSFARRSQALETTLQQRYYWNAAESVTTDFGTCVAVSTTSGRCFIPNPTTMRVAPTPTATVGSMTQTGSTGTQINLTALAATSGATTQYGIGLTTTVTLGFTIGNAGILQSNSGVGAVGGNAEL
jgi:hypothetical protein